MDFCSRGSEFDCSELAFLSLFTACGSDSGTHFYRKEAIVRELICLLSKE